MNSISIEPVCPVEPVNPTNKVWKSCCLTMNPSAVKYFVQVGILSILIVFSATMLVVDNRC